MATRRRKRRTPARGRSGRFVAKTSTIRRRRRRTVLANPRRRRSVARRSVSRRRNSAICTRRGHVSYQRNPRMLGLSLPSAQDFGYVAAGYIGPQYLAGYIYDNLIPKEWKTSSAARWGVELATVVALAFAADKLLGKLAGEKVMLGGGVYLSVKAIKEFIPSTAAATPTKGYVGDYIGRGGQPSQISRGNVGAYLPSRLSVAERF